MANLTLKAWPQPVTDEATLERAAALEATLNEKNGKRWDDESVDQQSVIPSSFSDRLLAAAGAAL